MSASGSNVEVDVNVETITVIPSIMDVILVTLDHGIEQIYVIFWMFFVPRISFGSNPDTLPISDE
jgi:hypothetical protein